MDVKSANKLQAPHVDGGLRLRQGVETHPPQLLCPPSSRALIQSASVPAGLRAAFFFAPRAAGAAGRVAACSASRARRSARSRSVLARIAAAVASYSATACLASFAFCNLANWAWATSFLEFSAIRPPVGRTA